LIVYLVTDDVLTINQRLVGPDQLRDFGLLDAAVTRPQMSAHGADAFPTIHEKAAALLHALARTHPFVTANKRTSWMATAMFYMVNGYNLYTEAGQVVGLTVVSPKGRSTYRESRPSSRNGRKTLTRPTNGSTTSKASERRASCAGADQSVSAT
jgi:death-on-curing protein